VAEQVKQVEEKKHINDGKGLSITSMVLGICSIIFSVFLGFILGVLAIIFSAIGLKRKKNGFAIAGLVTGIIGVVASLIWAVAITIVAYAGITERAQDSSVQASASTVEKRAELFNIQYDAYPSFDEMQSDLTANGYNIVIDKQGTSSGGDVIYIPCYGYGAIIWYWSTADQEYKERTLGSTDSCEWNE